MIFDFGDVVVVPFPFTDIAVQKSRPSLVLSRGTFNRDGSTVLAMITTAKASAWSTDLRIEDIVAAGLVQGCNVRWKIFTLPNELITRGIGSLGAADRAKAQSTSRAVFP